MDLRREPKKFMILFKILYLVVASLLSAYCPLGRNMLNYTKR